MSEPIVINSVSGTNSDGNDLKGCYFKQNNEGTYDFHDKDGKEKAKRISPGSSFSFHLDQHEFTLSIAPGSSATFVSGSWNDGDTITGADGSYQAQAGGSEDAEANAASASY